MEGSKVGISYIPFLGWIPAVGFLFAEREHKIRFEAAQSLIIHAMVAGVYFVAMPLILRTGVLGFASWYIQGIVGVGFVLMGLWLVVQSRAGKEVRLGWIADWADKLAK